MTVSTRTAVIVGAGVGGLATAAALHRDGWSVRVLEKHLPVEPIGAGISIASNGLRALDTLGVGDRVRGLAAIHGDASLRTPDGRVVAASSADAFVRRFGDPMVLATRAALMETLLSLVPEGTLRQGSAVDVDPGDADRAASVTTADGEVHRADLVVAGDGIWSPLRRRLFPDHPAPSYAGFTTWRAVVPMPSSPLATGETWGRGRVFGAMPLADGLVYWYAAANRPAGGKHPDPRAELLSLFGGWHDPIPELVGSAGNNAILHLDVHWSDSPLPALHRGRVAVIGDAAHPMTPNLGQGGNQALEDAVDLAAVIAHHGDEVLDALPEFSALRLPRTTDVVRRSRRMGAMTQWESRPAVAVRNALLRLSARLSPDTAIKPLDSIMAWRPFTAA
ncbi:FAD-dependent monooxygenase [Streptodolium elevatio]|uniref:FAD-dependent monooxygenase n=1 Tax=Streptodolium elevatio TaxID=3157996 RepID=A0ABV3DJJ2_9ACTN